jgi:hypothetical protein
MPFELHELSRILPTSRGETEEALKSLVFIQHARVLIAATPFPY